MKLKKYKSAIIGCGDIAGKHDEEKKTEGIFSHAGAYKEAGRIGLTAAADIDARRLREFGEFWDIKGLYTDHLELLEKEELDILSICTPDSTHYNIIMDSLEINPPKILFAEKPLADSSREVLTILKQAEKVGTKIVVDYQRRWDKDHMALAKLVKAGGIGELQSVSAYYVKGILHVACHMINTLRFLISDISHVLALPPDKIGTFSEYDPSLDTVLFFRNGAKAVLQSCDKGGYTFSIFEIDLLGSDGRARILDYGKKIEYYKIAPYRDYPGFNELMPYKEVTTRMNYALLEGVKEIVRILDEDLKNFTNNGMESYRDLKIIEAIMNSKNKGWIKVDVSG